MCAGYGFFAPHHARFRFHVKQDLPHNYQASYNIRPGRSVPVVVRTAQGNEFDLMTWGFWSMQLTHRPINTRSETVTHIPAFKDALTSHRCLIPANCFYEWVARSYGKQPICFRLLSRPLFAFAGIYNVVTDVGGKEWKTFSVLTCPPNAVVKPIHDRMPVILPEAYEDDWLSPRSSVAALRLLLKPYDETNMDGYPISLKINKATYDQPDAVERVGDIHPNAPEQLHFQM